jgi:membrane-associated phospholipid phosphatase
MGSAIALLIAAILDPFVARLVNESGINRYLQTHHLREVMIAPGWFVFTLCVAVAVGFVHHDGPRASAFLLLTASSAALNEPIKWMVGRIRPYKIDATLERLAPYQFEPLRLHYVKNLCFPSGHTMLAFATAAALGMLWPRLRPLWYSIASIVAIERVAENAHWLSDVVAGAALGVGGVYLMAWLLNKWKVHLLTFRS